MPSTPQAPPPHSPASAPPPAPSARSCFKFPEPSTKGNFLLLTPDFGDLACNNAAHNAAHNAVHDVLHADAATNSTYVGGESNGIEVASPPLCGHWPFGNCPSAGLVSVRVTRHNATSVPHVRCYTEPPELKPTGWDTVCTGPFNATDGTSAVKFIATVVKNKTFHKTKAEVRKRDEKRRE